MPSAAKALVDRLAAAGDRLHPDRKDRTGRDCHFALSIVSFEDTSVLNVQGLVRLRSLIAAVGFEVVRLGLTCYRGKILALNSDQCKHLP